MKEQPSIRPERSEAPGEGVSERQFDGRYFILKLGFLLVFVLIALRLVQIQVIDSSRYRSMARKQHEQVIVLPAVRGGIFDRNNNVLVSSSTFVSFAADPKLAGEHAEEIAGIFARIFGRPREQYLARLRTTTGAGSQRRFVWLERRVRPEIAGKVETSTLPGIVVLNEPKRLYHYDEVAGTLIGFTDIDNKGISGIELEYDEYLRGRNGSVVMLRDGLGRARPSVDYPRIEPRDGSDVILTIDLAYQSIVEEELKRGVLENGADGALAVILNPKSGEILAMASVPGLNPNQIAEFNVNGARNRAVTDMFEPGSLFKAVTASAAYEHHLIAPDKRFDAEKGTYRVPLPRGRFRLIKDTQEHDRLTFEDAIAHSSNIVMAKASQTIGPERLYRQARDFGFGILTGVDLPGEVRGKLKKPSEWSGTTLQTLSYGYEVGATPLQIACAYAAVANGGVLMKPFIVSSVRSPRGKEDLVSGPQMIRRVVSEETAALLGRAFEAAVERGTGREARIPGVRIAGKTGTSRKVIDGKYGSGSYTSSFVGYFPAEDPQVVCLVMMDNPRARGYYGGVTAAPVFRAIAERIINTTGRFTRTPQPREQERSDPRRNGISVPDVRTLQVTIARRILEGQGLVAHVFGEGDIVIRQTPEPGKRLERGDIVQLAVNDESAGREEGSVVVPDLRGMSLRRAINRLVLDDFDVSVQGSGIVVQQSPPPGRKVNPGITVHLVCEPRPISAALY